MSDQESDKTQLREDQEQLRLDRIENQNTVADLQTAIKGVEKKLDTQKDANGRLADQVSRLRKDIDAANDIASQLRNDKKDAQTTIEHLQDNASRLVASKDDASNKCKSAQEETDGLKMNKISLESRVASLTSQLDGQKKATDSLLDQLSEAKLSTAAINKIGANVATSVDDAKRLGELAAQVTELNNKIAGLDRQIRELRADLDAANGEKRKLSDEIRKAQESHQTKQQAAQQEIDTLKKENKELGDQVSELQRDLDRLKGEERSTAEKFANERNISKGLRDELQKTEQDRHTTKKARIAVVEQDEFALAGLNLLLFDTKDVDNAHNMKLRDFMNTLALLNTKALDTGMKFRLDDESMLSTDGVLSVAQASTTWTLSSISFEQAAPYLRQSIDQILFKFLTVAKLRPQDDQALAMLEVLASKLEFFRNGHTYLLYDALRYFLDDDQATSERRSIIEARMIELTYFVCARQYLKLDELDDFRKKWLGRCPTREGRVQGLLLRAYADWFDRLVNHEMADLPNILYGLVSPGQCVDERKGDDPKRRLMSTVSATETLSAVVDIKEQHIAVFKAGDEGVSYNAVTRFVDLPVRRNKTNGFVAIAPFELPYVPVSFLRRNMFEVYMTGHQTN